MGVSHKEQAFRGRREASLGRSALTTLCATGLPAADPRAAHPARAHQQAVPAAGTREPHGHRQQAEADGARGEPALGQPPETRHGCAAEAQGNCPWGTGSSGRFSQTGDSTCSGRLGTQSSRQRRSRPRLSTCSCSTEAPKCHEVCTGLPGQGHLWALCYQTLSTLCPNGAHISRALGPL